MHSIFTMFARYNEWANRRIYKAAAGLSNADYRLLGGAFFGSVHATLNHLLVADRIWMRRFTGSGPIQTKLDEIIFEDFAALRAEREAQDRLIVEYIDGLDEKRLGETFSYRTIVSPMDVSQPLAPALAHFFNHQTHHRGQVHALLTARIGNSATPSLDLILFQRETGVGLS
jgi:uncharacterized damage-inducible protein DinB